MAGDGQQQPNYLWFEFNGQIRKVFEDPSHGYKLGLKYLHLDPLTIALDEVANLVDSEGWTTHSKQGLQGLLGNVGITKENAIKVDGDPGPGAAGVGVSTAAGGAGAGASATAEKPVLITFKKASVERTVTLTRMPSWLELCERVEEVFTELQAEAFSLLVDKLELSEPLWPGSVKSILTAEQTTMTLQVASKCKAFSSFKMSETWHVLGTATQYSEESAMHFPMAEYEVDTALDAELTACLSFMYKDIITLAGQELALRCLKTDPKTSTKEACKRELISPVIYAAAALAGDGVAVDAERSVTGALGKGNVDYTIQYDGFSIVVLESKLHETMEEHLGQLAAEMQATRDQYKRIYLGKRKHDDEGEFKKVPSFGILSNGTTYIFYKYTPEDKHLQQFTQRTNLDKAIKAADASQEVLPIIRRLVHMIKEQMESMKSFKRAKRGDA